MVVEQGQDGSADVGELLLDLGVEVEGVERGRKKRERKREREKNENGKKFRKNLFRVFFILFFLDFEKLTTAR